jgi:hypothetical protein
MITKWGYRLACTLFAVLSGCCSVTLISDASNNPSFIPWSLTGLLLGVDFFYNAPVAVARDCKNTSTPIWQFRPHWYSRQQRGALYSLRLNGTSQ